MHIAVCDDNVADRKQFERLIRRESERRGKENGILFADLFVRFANEDLSRNVEGFEARAAEMLASHTWPGNLRELNNVVKRAVLVARGPYITQEELSAAMGPVRQEPITALHDADTERQRILNALQQCGGNKSKAARMLGIDRKTLYNKLG